MWFRHAETWELFIISVVTICILYRGRGCLDSVTGLFVNIAWSVFCRGGAIAGSAYNHEVLGIIMPILDLMTSGFFISVGMMLSVAFMLENIVFIMALVAILILGKTVIATIIGMLSGASAGTAVIWDLGTES